MKVTEIFDSQQLNEKPMGLMKRAGLGVASALGSQSSGEKLEVGNRANFLRQKYNTYLNTSGQQATADSLLAFLKQVGYPTDAASKIVKAQPAQGQQGQKSADGQSAQDQQQPATGQQGQQPAQAQTQQPAQGQQDQQQQAAGQQPAQQQKQPAANKADTDSYEKFKGQIRQLQSTGDKQLPDKNTAGVEADIAKLAKGDKESGSFAAQKILNFAKAGYNVDNLAAKWNANSKAGERFLTQSVFIAISKMLQEHGLYWSDLGIKLRLDENVTGGVYISLMEEVKLDDKVIDQALTAAVQDAFKTGMLQIGADGKVKVGRGSSGAGTGARTSFGGGTLGNQTAQSSPIDEIKELIDQLDNNGKKQVINFLEKG